MEEINKLMEQNDCFVSSSDENYSDSESPSCPLNFRKYDINEAYTSSRIHDLNNISITSKKRNGEKRMPTRRPDPNVYNRNALLARENRRKKKEYLETIEKELQAARRANRVLAKALKRQLKIAQRLQKEKKCFEHLIKNRSDILTLSAYNVQCPLESGSDKSPLSETSSSEDFMYNGMGDKPNSTSVNTLNEAEVLSIQFDSPLNDWECTDNSLPSASKPWVDMWDNAYNTENLVLPEATLKRIENPIGSFNDDHCYVASAALSSTQPLKSNSCDDIDNEDCSNIEVFSSAGIWFNQASNAPPLQLLNDQ